jgi:hypothetical protein
MQSRWEFSGYGGSVLICGRAGFAERGPIGRVWPEVNV